MKQLRPWACALGLIGFAFVQSAILQAAESTADSEDLQPTLGCRSESYCFFESDSYAGRKAVFSDCDGTRQPLNPYGLAKKVSSWVNNSAWRILVEDAYGNRLWMEPPYSQSPDLEPGKDHQAWYFRCIR